VRIAEVGFPLLLDRGFDYEVPAALASAVSVGTRVRAPLGPRSAVGVVLSLRDGESPRKLKALEAALESEPSLTPEMIELARWLARRYCATLGECVRALLPSEILRKSERKGAAAAAAAAVFGELEPAAPPAAAFELTPSQSGALARVSSALDARRFSAHLLFGVPASGKTEVYLRLIRRAVADGGQALFLVPEISLTRPFFEHFSKTVFPDAPAGTPPVALWHSQLGQRERREVWFGLRRGGVRVVVGPRSACLLPFRALRLAVIDEEQDESYKQDGQLPYYHARDVVLQRARRFGASVVLGSATPSVESFQESGGGGEIELIEMRERVFAGTFAPPVRILDRPHSGCLGPDLLQALKDRLERREQSILLVNRRGFSNFAICRRCGWVARCPACEVALIHHHDGLLGYTLRCHHCGRSGPVPKLCGECHKDALAFAGIGTQKVISELRATLPGVRALRLDGDVSAERGDAEVYRRFLGGEADVLVGTKLVAKGFHFPRVTLVGVVDADTMLHMPDFRSAERTVQLLLQAAGRAGRAEHPGEVLLQTARPTDYAIQAVARGDYAGFCRQELEFRRELRYPPAAVLVRAVFSGKNEAAVKSGAEDSAAVLRAALGEESVIGPAPGLLARYKGSHRWHLLLKVDPARLDAARETLRSLDPPSSVRLKINVDPYDFV
jgi:primosomal protein N' (replication factor Y)